MRDLLEPLVAGLRAVMERGQAPAAGCFADALEDAINQKALTKHLADTAKAAHEVLAAQTAREAAAVEVIEAVEATRSDLEASAHEAWRKAESTFATALATAREAHAQLNAAIATANWAGRFPAPGAGASPAALVRVVTERHGGDHPPTAAVFEALAAHGALAPRA